MSLYMTPILPDELYHFGIKGQKWGRRRFQNEDMTWTAAGKERYGSASDGSHKVSAEEKKKTAVKDNNSSSTKSKKTRTPEEETKSAKRKEIAKKALIAAGTAAAVAGIAYFGSKKISNVIAKKDSQKMGEEALHKLSAIINESYRDLGDADQDRRKAIYDKYRSEIIDTMDSRRRNAFTREHAKADFNASLDDARLAAKTATDKYRQRTKDGVVTKLHQTTNMPLPQGINPEHVKSRTSTYTRDIVSERRGSSSSNIPRTKIQRTEIPRTKIQRTEIPRTEIERINVFADLDNLNDQLLKKNQRLLRNP